MALMRRRVGGNSGFLGEVSGGQEVTTWRMGCQLLGIGVFFRDWDPMENKKTSFTTRWPFVISYKWSYTTLINGLING